MSNDYGDEEGDSPFQNDNKNDFNYKLILVGESRVGKTSIITKYVENKFDPGEECSVNV